VSSSPKNGKQSFFFERFYPSLLGAILHSGVFFAEKVVSTPKNKKDGINRLLGM